ncbi:hypothetical protein DFH27DRAFT_627226 [Peziza echinospora]|nr:hypothetical protein DFH27DRAFT_627226 [Peziza echinospora]
MFTTTAPSHYQQPTSPSPSPSTAAPSPLPQLLTTPSPAAGKGGGALRPIDQTLAINPSSGTLSLALPIPLPSGRGGFTPSLSLCYNSGRGNGPVGVGWALSQESVTVRTSRNVPQYGGDDGAAADVYILSGGDELVPLDTPAAGLPTRVGDWAITHYRPRIESEIARIERWEDTSAAAADANIFFRTVSATNVTKVYGWDDGSRVFAAASSPSGRKRIFSWLLCESHDAAGNAARFEYKAEDGAGVGAAVCEAGRSADVRARTRYLKRIKYGNMAPSRDADWDIVSVSALAEREQGQTWMFEAVLDYGEHGVERPRPAEAEGAAWAVRTDPFSTYTSGFELRSYRVCRRVLVFHHFPAEGVDGLLSSSTVLEYDDSSGYTVLVGATQHAHLADGGVQSLPPTRFTYTKPTALETARVSSAKPESLQSVAGGVGRWVDLDGEGVPGILVEREGGWEYQRNENVMNCNDTLPSLINTDSSSEEEEVEEEAQKCEFGPIKRLPAHPTTNTIHDHYFEDLDGNGNLDLVTIDPRGRITGYRERIPEDHTWGPHKPFPQALNINTAASGMVARRIDLTGNGISDMLLASEGGAEIIWHESLSKHGFSQQRQTPWPGGPVPQLRGTPQKGVYTCDMSGDGLADIVHISNGRISYFPNLGYGRFAAEVVMGNPPEFSENAELFSLERLQLADVDGSGTTDVLYLPPTGGAVVYRNLSGNAWSDGVFLPQFPGVDSLSRVSTVDLLGKGTSCLCWTGAEVAGGRSEWVIKYIDLAEQGKPYLLSSIDNGMGLETSVEYTPSTKFYLRDEREGRKWDTRLPFPVHVVSRVVERDVVTGAKGVTKYRYHDGCYDGYEREFHGFGMVETVGWEEVVVEVGKKRWKQPKIETRMWFHTGAVKTTSTPSRICGTPSIPYQKLPSSAGGSSEYVDLRDACRALKGQKYRQEVYMYGGDGRRIDIPSHIEESTHEVHPIQLPVALSRNKNKNSTSARIIPGIYQVHTNETIHTTYSLTDTSLSDPYISHSIVLSRNPYGNATSAVGIQYGRRQHDPARSTPVDERISLAQETTTIAYTETRYTNAITITENFYKPIACQQKERVITIPPTAEVKLFTASTITALIQGAEAEGEDKTQNHPTKESRAYFRDTTLTHRLPLGTLEPFSVVDQTFELALTPEILRETYHDEQALEKALATLQDPRAGGYIDLDGDGRLWVPSSRSYYSTTNNTTPPLPSSTASTTSAELHSARTSFYTPTTSIDPFGAVTSQITMDAYTLLPLGATDSAGNVSCVEKVDYLRLKPVVVRDCNGNKTHGRYDGFGECIAVAVCGGDGEGDSLAEWSAAGVIDGENFLESLGEEGFVRGVLGDATAVKVYSRGILNKKKITSSGPRRLIPTFEVEISRTEHAFGEGGVRRKKSDDSGDGDILVHLRYFDGKGRPVQEFTLSSRTPHAEWCCSGTTINNSKGGVVLTSRPYLTDSNAFTLHTPSSTALQTLTFHDALGRRVGVLHPDHTWGKSVVGVWETTSVDEGGTVLITDPGADTDVGGYFRRVDNGRYLPSWHSLRLSAGTPLDLNAAEKSEVCAGSGVTEYRDPLGRRIAATQAAGMGTRTTHTVYDVFGNVYEEVDSLGRVVRRARHDLQGRCLFAESIDAGWERVGYDCLGGVVSVETAVGRRRVVYDSLRREVELWVHEGGGEGGKEGRREYLWCRKVYGEGVADAEARNLRGRVHVVRDQAGAREACRYDFKGNCLLSTVTPTVEYSSAVDWRGPVKLATGKNTLSAELDALSREVSSTDALGHTTRRRFNLLGQIVGVESTTPGEGSPPWTNHIRETKFTADGKPSRVEYGNSAITTYVYDTFTRKMIRKTTTRAEGSPLEDLTYTRDIGGRVVHVTDATQDTIFFRNQKVGPSKEYWYDEFGRLVRATGREMLSGGQSVIGRSDPRSKAALGGTDGGQLSKYTEHYSYDSADNMLELKHVPADPRAPQWSRRYAYEEPSMVEPAKMGNRLSRTSVGGAAETYTYNATGCMTSTPECFALEYDVFNRLRSTTRQRVGKDSPVVPERTWHVADHSGVRLRKVTVRAGQVGEEELRPLKETLYVSPASEIHHTYHGNGTPKSSTRTSYIFASGKGSPIVAIESTFDTIDTTATTPPPLPRYILSPTLEIDPSANIITYEEYTPFGASVLLLARSGVEAPSAYRFAGYRRDGDTGVYNCGTRSYSPALARWTTPDPLGTADGPNLYCYVGNDPVNFLDSTGTEGIIYEGYEPHEQYDPCAYAVSEGASQLYGDAHEMAVNKYQEYAAHFQGPGHESLGAFAYDIAKNLPSIAVGHIVDYVTPRIIEYVDPHAALREGSIPLGNVGIGEYTVGNYAASTAVGWAVGKVLKVGLGALGAPFPKVGGTVAIAGILYRNLRQYVWEPFEQYLEQPQEEQPQEEHQQQQHQQLIHYVVHHGNAQGYYVVQQQHYQQQQHQQQQQQQQWAHYALQQQQHHQQQRVHYVVHNAHHGNAHMYQGGFH